MVETEIAVINDETMPVRREDLMCHVVDDEALIYDAERNATHRLNCTAHFIWEQCDGTQTCESIVRSIAGRWEGVPAEVKEDVLAAMRQMASHGLIGLSR